MEFRRIEYTSPLEGVDTSTPLPDGYSEDGKSLASLPVTRKSDCYDAFPDPTFPADAVAKRGGADLHIYYQGDEKEHARKLHEAIRREFPELRIYKFFEMAVGPHPTPMFEVNVFTPAQLGALFVFLVAHRGPCSVLIHPNTGNAIRDHGERATWMGQPYPVNLRWLSQRYEQLAQQA